MKTTILLCVCLSAVGLAGEAENRERRVRVALSVAAAAQCGECKFDEAGCRKEATSANKPLVLFVGGPACSRCGTAVRSAGGIPCVVDRYDGDPTPRAVVLEPRPGGGFWLAATINGPTPAKIAEAVAKAIPPAKATGAKLDWNTK